MRAESVAKVLVAHGVPSWRLRPVGYGEARPLVPTPRGESNEKNRRVHFFTESSDAPADVEIAPAPEGKR
jgi:outer membrane protein OmpA-like peptidoglycan-associated protein